ncbi:hypothetical protein A3K80_00250 [Candidatus Bathyarchaeota archaeon RBG_13_38_9]|nr:MAG: hypothetical protein A3K80_00250 [Candidatus Bathyarchaeota archaeon RBG_13_38_9]
MATEPESEPNHMPDYLIAHYEEIGKECLFLDRLIWEIPSLALAIIVGIITVAYYYVSTLLIRMILLLIGIFWYFTIIVATEKHMLFVWNRKERLMLIEDRYFKIPDLPNVQRFGESKWYNGSTQHWKQLKGIQKLRAHDFLKTALYVTFIVLLFLEAHNIYLLYTN